MSQATERAHLARLFGAFLMAVGGLMATLCGLCTGVFTFMAVAGAVTSGAKVSLTYLINQLGGIAVLVLFIGVLPTAIGVALFLAGRRLRRPDPRRVGKALTESDAADTFD